MLIPNDKTKLGIIFEFKVKEKNETLQQAAQRALKQIAEKKYAVECQQRGIHQVVNIGIGFEGKEFVLESSDRL